MIWWLKRKWYTKTTFLIQFRKSPCFTGKRCAYTSLTFSTKKGLLEKYGGYLEKTEQTERTFDAWFFWGEGNDLSNDHHNSIENVIKNFSFFWAFMDMASSSLLGHHAQCLHNILMPASAFQTIYANWLRQSVPKRSGKKLLILLQICRSPFDIGLLHNDIRRDVF